MRKLNTTIEDRKANRLMYLPTDARCEVNDEIKTEVYIYEYLVNGEQRFGVTAFSGTRGKPDFKFYYTSEAQRQDKIDRRQLALKEQLVKEKARKDTVKVNPLKVGDILDSTWGYEQTNVDFYQVTEVKKSSVVLRKIASESVRGGETFNSGRVVPVKDSFTGASFLKRVSAGYDGGARVKLTSYSSASLWDGQPVTESWGH